MSDPKLKARDKVVVKMTKTGAVEENLTTGEVERISERAKDAELVKKTVETTSEPKKSRKRKQRYQPNDDKTAVEQSSAAVFDEKAEQNKTAESVDTSPTEQAEPPAEVADVPAHTPQENPVKEHTPSHK